ncbi:hypothetical protein PC128_g22445 [Phytophthora cactorum]|nr:hypothetical protein PC120_g20847 [Phytophthora cactorum]KAG3073120.1 hypothetical protein PC121_g8752 [Phytophthora cactorum]KAG3154117.1 hypothetical protein PC128_g22445 [Phytophthora cactorum]KAG4055575.1 hypothetical protein PC123_g9353 [Phytophthora cactorum]
MHYLAVGLAVFQDIVKTIEYPLYAHLDPGQRFGANLSRSALLALIHMGEEFKVTLSRITLDTVARVLTVTFKGKKTTAWWVNWRLPLARRLLTLRDYERQRDTTKVTYELVKLDYYRFTISVKKKRKHGHVQRRLLDDDNEDGTGGANINTSGS